MGGTRIWFLELTSSTSPLIPAPLVPPGGASLCSLVKIPPAKLTSSPLPRPFLKLVWGPWVYSRAPDKKLVGFFVVQVKHIKQAANMKQKPQNNPYGILFLGAIGKWGYPQKTKKHDNPHYGWSQIYENLKAKITTLFESFLHSSQNFLSPSLACQAFSLFLVCVIKL